MTLKDLREKQRELSGLILDRSDKEALRIFLVFSYLGARICYAESHPLMLFEEEKFKDFERFKSFLLHLKRAGHFSVFAHTPLFVDLKGLNAEHKLMLAKSYFKVFWGDEVALFNLRHLAETLTDHDFLYLINREPDLDEIEVVFARNYQILYQGRLSDLDNNLLKDDDSIFAHQEVVLLKSLKRFPFNWIGVITHNFSRIFSHQFVRHTWLNFNQRSHRYTKVDRFVIPKAFKEAHIKQYEEIIQRGMAIYHDLSKNLKKESARFVVPQGVATSLLATGPELVWQDFVDKRAIPQAQEEIRDLAVFLKEVLALST
ncbi:MAG: FAD-dependent thymidylate synthase [Caldimicrobium sp.]|nr:FAD-dependent thymidylate synthase [Caldimicrobium sp.]MCX7612657.1 FAD-dependent thymidylate synthase [Caldimicrobium sp.]MDW8182190.1 FAD-dependent thymidylate synthase [Caldimicrobium sp.]